MSNKFYLISEHFQRGSVLFCNMELRSCWRGFLQLKNCFRSTAVDFRQEAQNYSFLKWKGGPNSIYECCNELLLFLFFVLQLASLIAFLLSFKVFLCPLLILDGRNKLVFS